jgi:hypothetical protein
MCLDKNNPLKAPIVDARLFAEAGEATRLFPCITTLFSIIERLESWIG